MRRALGGLTLLLVAAAGAATGCGRTAGDATESRASNDPALVEGVRQVAVERAELANLAGQLAEQCGLTCKAIADGNASISGDRAIDAFFGATLNFRAQTDRLRAEVQADILDIALAAGVENAASLDLAGLVAGIDARVQGGFGGTIQGDLQIDFVPPRCEVTASATVEAAARCDAEVTPGSAEIMCSGACEADASIMASCQGNATLTCRGTPPSFACSGECRGNCVLETGGAECEGTCMGACELTGNAVCDGVCMGQLLGNGNCMGACQLNAGARCTGTCMGSCELTAPGATCNGECRGECTYTPPSGSCEAGATARCEASGNASIMCEGRCEGEVTPPMVKAECEATARAEAMFAAECFPPQVQITYELSATAQAAFAADATARATFEGQIRAIADAFASLRARGARIDGILQAGAGLTAAGAGAVTAAVTGLTGSNNLQVSFNAACAVLELPRAGTILSSASQNLTASGQAVTDVSAALGATGA